MRFFRSPLWLQWLYPGMSWHRSRDKRIIYLTFDDGPIPDVTPHVLKILKSYEVNATFFCVGENVARYPELYHELKVQGHRTGNHTHNHLKGWETPTTKYLENVAECNELVASPLFRPPYGKLTNKQYRLLKREYEVVMWDVITYDFDSSLSPQKCLEETIRRTKNGSIVVFHDNIKAEANLLYTLPRAIEQWKKRGYTFETL